MPRQINVFLNKLHVQELCDPKIVSRFCAGRNKSPNSWCIIRLQIWAGRAEEEYTYDWSPLNILQLPGYSNHVNPYTGLLCDALRANGGNANDYRIKSLFLGPKPHIVHVHWPEWWLTLSPWSKARSERFRLLAGLRLAKLRGAKIFWTAHNLRPHERLYPEAETEFYEKWFRMVDGIICLTEVGERQLVEAYPELAHKPRWIVPHGDYRPTLHGMSREVARKRLELADEDFVIGHYGVLRSYKNTPALIRTFAESRPGISAKLGRRARLLVGGNTTNADLIEEVRAAADGVPDVTLVIRYVEADELEAMAVSSDLIVMPFKDIHNSGSALYALSNGRPILVPRSGSMPEIERDVGPDWVQIYDGDLDASTLEAAALRTAAQPATSRPNLHRYSWEESGRLTMVAYRTVLGQLEEVPSRPQAV